MTDIYYLAFASNQLHDDRVGQTELREVRARFSYGEEIPDPAEFRRYYRYVGTEPDADRSAVWEAWNAGSGHESARFEMARERSMSVGDVVFENGEAYIVRPIGWARAPALDGEAPGAA